jgi:NitT/TauT family transport system substrate-binding protein
MNIMQSRRDFLATLSAAGAASALGARTALADEGPPETTTIRLNWYPNICLAPGFISEDLLRAEGFTDVHYVRHLPNDAVARGEIDFDFDTAAWVVSHLDAGEPLAALAGVHSGCYELFAHEPIRAISDLKGKKLGIYELGNSGHLLLTVIAAQVGLYPHKDIEWVTSPTAMELFAEGKVDASLGFPPSHSSCARARSVGWSST